MVYQIKIIPRLSVVKFIWNYCVWGYQQTKCFIFGMKNSIKIVKDQAATSDNKHDEISSCLIYAFTLTCRLIKI